MYVRIPLIFLAFAGLLELCIDSGDQPTVVRHPIILLVLAVFLVLQIAVEFIIKAFRIMVYLTLPEDKQHMMDEKAALKLAEPAWYKGLLQRLTRSQPIENEAAIMTSHEYDGIKELDNNLPPWWLYLFYGGIIFAAVYLVRYEVMGGDDQETELRKEMVQAEIDVNEYKKHAPDLMDEKTVTQLADAPSLAKGKTIFESNCAACHRADGGGQIGPNLTDDHWIFGGDVKNVFHTITNGGRDGKGMVAWKGTLKPTEIQLVASYVLSLQGTNPKDPKGPDGDLWVKPGGGQINSATIK